MTEDPRDTFLRNMTPEQREARRIASETINDMNARYAAIDASTTPAASVDGLGNITPPVGLSMSQLAMERIELRGDRMRQRVLNDPQWLHLKQLIWDSAQIQTAKEEFEKYQNGFKIDLSVLNNPAFMAMAEGREYVPESISRKPLTKEIKKELDLYIVDCLGVSGWTKEQTATLASRRLSGILKGGVSEDVLHYLLDRDEFERAGDRADIVELNQRTLLQYVTLSTYRLVLEHQYFFDLYSLNNMLAVSMDKGADDGRSERSDAAPADTGETGAQTEADAPLAGGNP